MSRFIDKLKKASQVEAQPLGFSRKKVSSSKQSLVLVAEVKTGTAAGVAEGADAVLLEGAGKNPPEKMNLPMGIRLYGGKTCKLKDIDFVVFTPELPVTIAADEKTGRVMAVEASLEMSLLRSLDDLPLDALFITGDDTQAQIVTWQYLMLCKRFAALSSKPVLAAVSLQINRDELQLLWEVGISGVVVAAKKAGDVKKLRLLIDGLTLPSKSRRAKMRAIVPKLREESTPVVDDEDEDEDEEYE